MIDQVLEGIVDQVSLEGNEGCSFDQLFSIVQDLISKALEKVSPAPIKFDDKYKCFIWLHLKNLEQLRFIHNNTVIDPSALTYFEMKELGSHLLVKTTEESQDQSMLGAMRAEKKNLTDHHIRLLGVISKSKSQGISQHQLGEKLNMDGKTVFYYLKKLEALKLIVKETVYVNSMNTRMIYLTRFAKVEKVEENESAKECYRVRDFKDNLLKQLADTKDNMMTLQDAIQAMGFVTERNVRWARVKIAQLHDQGIVEKFNARNGKISRSAVRLLDGSKEHVDREEPVLVQEETTQRDALCRDLPSEYLFFKDIESSKEKGFTRQDLIDKYPIVDPDILKTFLDGAVLPSKYEEYAPYVIYKAEELGGKVRLFRYFGREGWRRFNENLGKSIVYPTLVSKNKSLDTEEPPSIDHIGRALDIYPRTKIPIKRALAIQAKEMASANDTDEPTPKKNKTHPTISTSNTESSRSRPKRKMSELEKSKEKVHNDSLLATADTSINHIGHNEPKETNNTNKDQQASAITEAVIKKVEPERKKARRAAVNSTKIRRCNILLDMMEKQPIRELSVDTHLEFNEIESAAAGGQKMAITTFNKMAKQLHEEKKLKLFITSVQKPFGAMEIKTFLLHSSLSQDSDQVKEFLEGYKEEKSIMESTSKTREIRQIAVPEIPRTKQSQTESVKSTEQSSLDINVAVEYGWIKSRWIRAKELHLSLMDHYIASQSTERIVVMSKYIQYITVNTLIKLVSSLPYSDERFKRFIDVEENRNISLNGVPEDIRLLIFKSRMRIRFLINQFLGVLVALGLLKPLNPVTEDTKPVNVISLKYVLCEEGILRDYAFKDRKPLKSLSLKTPEDISYFWQELQSTCIRPKRYRSEQDKNELEEAYTVDDPLYHIDHSRGWYVEVILSSKQKEILNSYIKKDTTGIPSDNVPLRIHLTKLTKLTPQRIRSYYTGLMGALAKKQTKEERLKAKLQRSLAMSSNATINELILASKEKRKVDTAVENLKLKEPFVLSTYIGSRRVRRLRVRTEPFQGNDHATRSHKIRNVPDLSDLEKDLLLYSYCIMKTRAKHGKFFWEPVAILLSRNKKEECRRAFNAMKLKDPNLEATANILMKKWERFYKDGIKSKRIQDENPWDTRHFDLSPFVEYFLLRLQEEENAGKYNDECALPLDVHILHQRFSILHNKIQGVENDQEPIGHSWTICTFKRNEYDLRQSGDYSSQDIRDTHLSKTLIKMLLMTPDELYDSNSAFDLFNRYPEHIVEEASKSLSAEKLIIKDASRYGRVPGRTFNVSEKFLKLAEGQLPPHLMEDARTHYNKIVPVDTLALKDPFNSGIVASTLALLSQDKVTLYAVHIQAYKRLKNSIYYPKASSVSLREAFVYKNLEIAIKKTVPIPPIKSCTKESCMDAKIMIQTPTEIEHYLHHLKKEYRLANTIYDTLRTSKENGLSLNDIIWNLNEIRQTDTDLIKSTIETLVQHDPPLICIVGFEHLRYIAADYRSSWLLKTECDKTFLNPLMWNDVSGTVIQVALQGCSETLISHVLSKPGISHANLRKQFGGLFTEYELYTLIQFLIQSKIIVSKKIQRTSCSKRVSIFDKKTSLKAVKSSPLVSYDEITFYWISTDYYLLKIK